MKRLLCLLLISGIVFQICVAGLALEGIPKSETPCVSAGGVSTPVDATETLGSIEVPVLMYHRLLKSNSQGDPYTISPAAFECDLRFLRDAGYTAVKVQQLIDFVKYGTPLPEKPVLLTFDDGHFNNLYYGAPLLEEYGMRATIFVVGEYCEMSSKENAENPNYSYLTWTHMENLPDCLDVQNHTWGLHTIKGGRNGIERKWKEELCDYQMMLASDLLTLNDALKRCTGKQPVALAFPFGAQEEASLPVLKAVGIEATFGSYEGISKLHPGDPTQLYRIKRLLRTPQKPASQLLSKCSYSK